MPWPVFALSVSAAHHQADVPGPVALPAAAAARQRCRRRLTPCRQPARHWVRFGSSAPSPCRGPGSCSGHRLGPLPRLPLRPALLITSKPRPLSAPAGLFLNTKSDLGPCEFELHEDHLDWDALKADYDALAEREKERCVWACCCCRRCCRPRWRAAVARHGMGAGMWDGWGGGGGAA